MAISGLPFLNQPSSKSEPQHLSLSLSSYGSFFHQGAVATPSITLLVILCGIKQPTIVCPTNQSYFMGLFFLSALGAWLTLAPKHLV